MRTREPREREQGGPAGDWTGQSSFKGSESQKTHFHSSPESPVLLRLSGRRKVGSARPVHLSARTLGQARRSPARHRHRRARRFRESSARRRCSYSGRVEADEELSGLCARVFKVLLQDSLWKNLAHLRPPPLRQLHYRSVLTILNRAHLRGGRGVWGCERPAGPRDRRRPL